jgi:NAD-reducing hydrogenase large subunit
MHYGQILQSHALHFFHLSSPDLLFGFESPVQQRNIVGVAGAYPEVARQGVLLRKFGQEVIRITAGKRVHGTGAMPGGVNKSLTAAERDELLQDADQMIQWSRDAVHLARRLHETNGSLYDEFGCSAATSSARAGRRRPRPLRRHLRLRDARGQIVLDHLPCADYDAHITEEVKPWSYMKFPFITELGPARAGTRWARWRGCRTATSSPARSPSSSARPSSPTARASHPRPAGLPLGAHDRDAPRRRGDPQPARRPGPALRQPPAEGPRGREGVGIIEAPRGTLIHHYRVGDDDLVSYCNLIVSTTHNNQAMNEAVRQVARRYLDGRQLTEGLLNTSRSPSAPSTPACPAPPTPWARCRWRSSCRCRRQPGG